MNQFLTVLMAAIVAGIVRIAFWLAILFGAFWIANHFGVI